MRNIYNTFSKYLDHFRAICQVKKKYVYHYPVAVLKKYIVSLYQWLVLKKKLKIFWDPDWYVMLSRFFCSQINLEKRYWFNGYNNREWNKTQINLEIWIDLMGTQEKTDRETEENSVWSPIYKAQIKVRA